MGGLLELYFICTDFLTRPGVVAMMFSAMAAFGILCLWQSMQLCFAASDFGIHYCGFKSLKLKQWYKIRSVINTRRSSTLILRSDTNRSYVADTASPLIH